MYDSLFSSHGDICEYSYAISGGCIYGSQNSSLVLNASVLTRNSASEGQQGPVMYIEGGRLELISCDVSDNKAYQFGVVTLLGATIQIISSNFSNNLAVYSGSSIYIGPSNELLALQSSENIKSGKIDALFVFKSCA